MYSLTDDWINPRLHYIKDPAKAVTEYVKECIDGVEDLYLDATATCLRVGSVNEIFHHPQGGLEPAVMMSGHEFSGTCRIFEYVMQGTATLSVGARILSGYYDPRAKSYGYKAVFLNESNRDKVMQFMHALFHDVPSVLFERDLLKFTLGVFAAGLSSLKAYRDEYGAEAIIYKVMGNLCMGIRLRDYICIIYCRL